ncbi:MAG TPA: hypothetical protein VFU21_13125 [Kofleriaceae bacterium]|nr:hypothetical protein [Kofleriaceae bacterium]
MLDVGPSGCRQPAPEADDDRPFFLYVAPTAPHGPAISAPRHAGLFTAKQLPDDPAFNEPKVADKPAWIRAKPLLDAAQIDAIRESYPKRLRSLRWSGSTAPRWSRRPARAAPRLRRRGVPVISTQPPW